MAKACGHCKWLLSCDTTPDTKACKDFKPRNLVTDIIKRDIKIKRAIQKVKVNPIFKVDKTLGNELLTYRVFDNHNFEFLIFSTEELRKLSGLIVKNQSWRDRTIEIKFLLGKNYHKLSKLYQLTKSYIFDTYGELLADVKTDSLRNEYIAILLKDIETAMANFEFYIDLADSIIANLDKSAFALKELVELGIMVYKRESMPTPKSKDI